MRLQAENNPHPTPPPKNNQNMHNPNNSSDPDSSSTLAHEPKLPIPLPPCAFTKFIDLPREIQRNIFEMAYHLTKGKWGNDLVYVSRNVREWVDPLIYESIVLAEDFGGGSTRPALYERTFRSKPKEFYTKNVRRIFMNNTLHNSDFEPELLQICDNLVSLECWSKVREDSELSTILQTKTWPRLKTLCIDIDSLPKDEDIFFRLPLFKYVTHLDFSSAEPQLPSCEGLKFLDNLTHMRVHLLEGTESHQFRLAMDQTYAIATEAQECFPPNLEHFIILVPIVLLFHICNMEHEAFDKQRWECMENLRLGTFDPRIMLGCYGSWEDWYNNGDLSSIEDDLLDILTDYNGFVPSLSYLDWPHVILGEDEKDRWAEEVLLKDQLRKEFLALQKK